MVIHSSGRTVPARGRLAFWEKSGLGGIEGRAVDAIDRALDAVVIQKKLGIVQRLTGLLHQSPNLVGSFGRSFTPSACTFCTKDRPVSANSSALW
jgi:hypothetical protein